MRSACFLFKLISAVLFSVIMSVGIIGVSYSNLTATQTISSSASMGNIDVVFSNLSIVQDCTSNPSCVTEAKIVDNGKHIEINIGNAYPGFTETINYEVTNNGTVPLIYKVNPPSGNTGAPVQLTINENSDYICGNGGQALGKIIITVGDNAGQSKSYSLYTELNFQQAVVEIG
jgi:hypothetical protein